MDFYNCGANSFQHITYYITCSDYICADRDIHRTLSLPISHSLFLFQVLPVSISLYLIFFNQFLIIIPHCVLCNIFCYLWVSECSVGRYGDGCSGFCTNCIQQKCEPVNGICYIHGCNPGWKGHKCDTSMFSFNKCPTVSLITHNHITRYLHGFTLENILCPLNKIVKRNAFKS